mmetsp:Transcript_3219/g.7292  ORF Transcript_3219/g.7292 Transcript_3219/m.7292 type:complete len:300 (+) Transcript_3219:347-1246(+)
MSSADTVPKTNFSMWGSFLSSQRHIRVHIPAVWSSLIHILAAKHGRITIDAGSAGWRKWPRSTAHACKLGSVSWRCRERVVARVLEGVREGVRSTHLVLLSGALDGPLAHRLGVHLRGRVVVDRAVDGGLVAVKGLPDETVRRHRRGHHAQLERLDRDVDPLLIVVLLRPAQEAAGGLHLKLAVANGQHGFPCVLAREIKRDVVDNILRRVGRRRGHLRLRVHRPPPHVDAVDLRGDGGARRRVGEVREAHRLAGGGQRADIDSLDEGAVHCLEAAALARAAHHESLQGKQRVDGQVAG